MVFDNNIRKHLRTLVYNLSVLTNYKKDIVTSIKNKSVNIPDYNKVSFNELPHYINLIEPGFNYISNIHHVNITDDYYLGQGAFANCVNLVSVDVTKFHPNQNMIPPSCFYNCQLLSVVKGLTDTSKLGNFSNILSIGDYAFYNCHLGNKSTVSQIHFNKKLKYIGHHAFDSIKSISLHPWYNLQYLDQLEFIGDAAFKNNIHVWCHLQLPKSVKHIGASAFYNCSNLRCNHSSDGHHSINHLTNLTSLGEYAYYGCSNLHSAMLFPPSLKSIKRYTFAECTSIPGANLSNIISVYDCAYYNCKKLSNIKNISSVKYIGPSAFYNCIELQNKKDLTFNLSNFNNVSSIGNNALYNVSPKNLTCYLFDYNDYVVPGNMNFKNTVNLNIYSNTSNGTLNYIPANICNNNNKIQTVVLSSNIKNIENSAFYNCSKLASISTYALTSIGDQVFYNCINLNSVNLNNGINSIGSEAFYNTEIKNIILPNNLTSINSGTFKSCKNLTEINIKDKVQSIYDNAFLECNNLKTITFGKSIKYIGKSSFKDCKKLTSITLNEQLTTIDISAFANCNSLQTVNFVGTKLTAINDYAFCNCSNLTSINIPSSVKYIGKSAFHGCTKLKLVIINNNSDLEIAQRAFYNCNKLESITINSTNLKLGTGIFKSDSTYSEINKELILKNIFEIDVFEKTIINETDKYTEYKLSLGKIFNTTDNKLRNIWQFFDLPKPNKSNSYHVIRYKYKNNINTSQLMGNMFGSYDISKVLKNN